MYETRVAVCFGVIPSHTHTLVAFLSFSHIQNTEKSRAAGASETPSTSRDLNFYQLSCDCDFIFEMIVPRIERRREASARARTR